MRRRRAPIAAERLITSDGRTESRFKRSECGKDTHILDKVDKPLISRLDETGDSDTDLLRVRETRLDIDLADLLRLRP